MSLITPEVGEWTVAKLAFLSDYLAAFADATSKISGEVTYLDLFSGSGAVRGRKTKEEHDGSPLIAAKLYPRLNNLILCDADLDNLKSTKLRVGAHVPAADFHAILGDSNTNIAQILSHVPPIYGASFAFLDPYSHTLNWSTIEAIADHKRRSRYKIELFILFPFHMSINRVLGSELTLRTNWPQQEAVLDDVMPDNWRWKRILRQYDEGDISREEFRRRFIFLYWQGLQDLGYLFVPNPKLLSTNKHRPLYTLMFASDHKAGNEIMSHVLHKQRRLGQNLQLPNISEPWNFGDLPEWYSSL